jgi:hypothetical protein
VLYIGEGIDNVVKQDASLKIAAMQTENAKSLSTEECAWKFSKKGT